MIETRKDGLAPQRLHINARVDAPGQKFDNTSFYRKHTKLQQKLKMIAFMHGELLFSMKKGTLI